MKTVLIEDEKNTREALKKMLLLVKPTIEIVGEAASVTEAIKEIQEKKPELIFLDIQLEDGTSFDVLNKLNKVTAKIIFTTAYSQYAIKAFKFSAIDYLLKPIDPSDLLNAIEKASSQIESENEYNLLLKNLENNIHSSNKKITIKTSENTYFIPVTEIIRLEGDGSYTIFITTKTKIMASKNIKYYQDLLGESFLRCHQSHLVNQKYIVELNKHNCLILSNKEVVPVSSRKKSEIKLLLKSL